MKTIAVPILVLGTIGCMLMPVPPTLMDFLIGANLVFAIALLLSALALTDTLKLTSLPALLLLATLFRLALNVSSTRNILSGGEAGQIIDAFGKLVVSGNLVVGMVIFAIITLVQFIVIAKGSERVAEVAARFTLDALPGKQMSLDADLRSGLLDMSQARLKRQDLQTESRFYGALDGAMKFVKGDAIAGIVITLINLIGGIAVGTLVLGLDAGAAVQKYCLLSIGDGLAAQIPSLLNSLAAGIVVTRVSRGDERTLAHDLVQQLQASRAIKVLMGLFSLGLAFAPEMPVLPFLTLGGWLLVSAAMAPRAYDHEDAERAAAVAFQPRPPALVSLELASSQLSTVLSGGRTGESTSAALNRVNQKIRERVFTSRGLLLPALEFAQPERAVGSAVRIRGITCWESATDLLEGQLVQAVSDVVIEHGVEVVDDAMTRRLIESLDPVAVETVNTVVPTVVSVTQLTELLKSLVAEGVPIRSFDTIAQAVSEHAGRVANARMLLEEVRIALRRVIMASLSSRFGGGAVAAVRLDGALDYQISRLERAGQPLSLELIERLPDFVRENTAASIVVVSRGARRLVREVLELSGLRLPVVALEELTPQISVQFLSVLEPTSTESVRGESMNEEEPHLERRAA